MTEIIHAESSVQLLQIGKLFIEYAEDMAFELCFQGFDKEIEELPGLYSPPGGRLLLALHGGIAAGCSALRKLDDEVCEMKRLFTKPEFRGLGIGKLLAQKIIEEARIIGYRKMRLETVKDKMKEAVSLYMAFGFKEIEPYYDNPVKGVLYMEMEL